MTETVVETSTAIVPRAATAALTPRPRPPLLLVSALAWLVAAVVTVQWPNIQNFGLTVDLGLAQGAFAVLSLLAYLLRPRLGIVGDRLDHNAARLTAIAVLLTIWQVATAKTGYWRQPYFPPPQKIVEAYVVDHARLLESIRASLVLLGLGMTIGASVGFLSGLFTGWSPRISYWIQPVLRLIGPIPTTALIPLALFLFPTTFSASLFLLALATWFPVAVLTSSGVASVSTAYYDVARTLGASNRFLLLHIAIPASLPHVFVGLFMGLGHAIAVLVVAEMIGVKAGLGYYLDWAQGWGAYGHLYAALIIMMLLFSTLTLLLFRLRDRLLAWQEDVVAW